MSLSSAMEAARSSLSVLSERTSVSSRNVANAGNDHATRKIAHTVTAQVGFGVRIESIARASDGALFNTMMDANSIASQNEAIVASLDALDRTVGDVQDESSPAAAFNKLADALQKFGAAPHEPGLAQHVVSTATNAANTLNQATLTVQQTREKADRQIADSVANLNVSLARFEEVNNDIIIGTRYGEDVTDLVDAREKLLTEISVEIGVRSVTRTDNDMVLYTDSGVTLFEKKPREVRFTPSGTFTATTTGGAVTIDGVDVTGNTSPLPLGSGRIRGLVQVRDDIAVTYQTQLDEMARGLITAFQETDQSAIPSLPNRTGAFTYSGSPVVPPAATVITGLAGEIQLNPAVDPAQGGDAFLFRDGGINGAAYIYNSTGAASFSGRLRGLQDNLYATTTFDAAAQIQTSSSLMDFSSNSVGWLQEVRQNAASENEFRKTVFDKASDSLSKVTGINLDYEMTLLLDMERSYQATSRLISTIDNMFESLLTAAR